MGKTSTYFGRQIEQGARRIISSGIILQYVAFVTIAYLGLLENYFIKYAIENLNLSFYKFYQ